MARFCFLEQRGELFAESAMRGWLSAILDFPQLKGNEERIVAAQHIPDALRPEVCCVPAEDDYPYQSLVANAWYAGYTGLLQITEREIVLFASVLKRMSHDEAMTFLRTGLSRGEGREEIERVYRVFETSTHSQF